MVPKTIMHLIVSDVSCYVIEIFYEPFYGVTYFASRQ